ncbi:MAG TPA: DUF3325 domain-containing protein [Alcaligenes sp.]|nr:DUF3325 domain-containing protein [Alcaligenes sp.]HRL27898.1 DUF3325 domain-containing protein [Alcaligenes sp.]
MNALSLSWLEHSTVFLSACLGFACLALAMIRHQEDVFGRELSSHSTRVLRWAGGVLVVLAGYAAVRFMGWGFGLTAYSGHTSVAAGVVYLGLLLLQRFRSA